jgi:hypothetical protein
MSPWPRALDYSEWSATCDTLHAHTQVLGKLCVALAPPEPELQHAALRLTARGWETRPLPVPDGSGAFVAALDLHSHEAIAEHSDGSVRRVPLTPNRPVGEVTRELLEAIAAIAGEVTIDPKPQEVPWTSPLDQDAEHATYDTGQIASYFETATLAALVLAEFRAPFRGRSTALNAWWGSFDLAVSLFSGSPADPPSDDFIMRNSMDSEEVAVGWWPGDPRYGKAAFYAYAHPAPPAYSAEKLPPPAAHWADEFGFFALDWDDINSDPDPHSVAVHFARSAFRHACEVCQWDPELAATADGVPPPVH